jgi:hypothetical protein
VARLGDRLSRLEERARPAGSVRSEAERYRDWQARARIRRNEQTPQDVKHARSLIALFRIQGSLAGESAERLLECIVSHPHDASGSGSEAGGRSLALIEAEFWRAVHAREEGLEHLALPPEWAEAFAAADEWRERMLAVPLEVLAHWVRAIRRLLERDAEAEIDVLTAKHLGPYGIDLPLLEKAAGRDVGGPQPRRGGLDDPRARGRRFVLRVGVEGSRASTEAKRSRRLTSWRGSKRECEGTSGAPVDVPEQDEGGLARAASELGCLLRIVLRRWEARLGVPRGARAGGTPLAHTHHLQVSLCVLGRRERLPEPRLCPCRKHQPLVCHLKELGSYLGVAKEPLLKLQEGQVQGAKELGVGEVGEGLLEVGDGLSSGLFFGEEMPIILKTRGDSRDHSRSLFAGPRPNRAWRIRHPRAVLWGGVLCGNQCGHLTRALGVPGAGLRHIFITTGCG